MVIKKMVTGVSSDSPHTLLHAFVIADICIPASTPTSPETTILDILAMRHRNENDTVYQFVDFYTNVRLYLVHASTKNPSD